MAESRKDADLYLECLAAMAVSGDVYPCETLAPDPQSECALPDHHAPALAGQTERT